MGFTSEHIQYSFSREGVITTGFQNLGLSKLDKIKQIGSTENYIWLLKHVHSKLDHSSGSYAGTYPFPDELNVESGVCIHVVKVG